MIESNTYVLVECGSNSISSGSNSKRIPSFLSAVFSTSIICINKVVYTFRKMNRFLSALSYRELIAL